MSEIEYQPTDRRPIASRKWPIWEKTATLLVKRGVTANSISVAGMVAGLLAGVSFALTRYVGHWTSLAWFGAALFIQLRLLANLLDGMVAIESKQASPVGELYNEVPDRVSDAGTLIGAGYALGGCTTMGFCAAIVAVFVAYVRAIGKAGGAGNDFCGPMAKQHRMALMTGVALLQVVLPVAWVVGWGKDGWGLTAVGLAIVVVGGLATAGRRLIRIANTLNKRTS